MKTKIKYLCFLCAAAAVLSYSTGCGASKPSSKVVKNDAISQSSNAANANANKLVGNWRYQKDYSYSVSKYSFSSSGTFTHSVGDGMNKGNGTYSVSSDGTLTLNIQSGPTTGTMVLEYLSSDEIASADGLAGHWGFDSENKLYIDSKDGYIKE